MPLKNLNLLIPNSPVGRGVSRLSAYFKAEAFKTTGLNVSTDHVTIPAHISAKNGYEAQHWLPDALQLLRANHFY